MSSLSRGSVGSFPSLKSLRATLPGVVVDRRTIYASGKRKGFVWDARVSVGGRGFDVMASSEREALTLLVEDVVYVQEQRSESWGGVRLRPWLAARDGILPTWELQCRPSGGWSMFGALDWDRALASVREGYGDHETVAPFLAWIDAGCVPPATRQLDKAVNR